MKKMEDRPPVEKLEEERDRIQYKKRYCTVLKSTVYTLMPLPK